MFEIWYSEGIGNKPFYSFTDAYKCAEFTTKEECKEYIKKWDHFRARWEIKEN